MFKLRHILFSVIFALSIMLISQTATPVYAANGCSINQSGNGNSDVTFSGVQVAAGDTITIVMITPPGDGTYIGISAFVNDVSYSTPHVISYTFAAATTVNIILDWEFNGLPQNTYSVSCQTASDVEVLFNPGDDRINHHVADRAAPAAIYCQYEGVQVIRIDPVTAKGTDEIRLTAAEIEAAGVPAEGNTILAQTEWAILARLADGRFSLNSWYIDGKPYTITWGECSLESIEYIAR
jgi:hypothetical protein